MSTSLRTTATKALEANPMVLKRLELAAPTAQYKAVGVAIARVIAKKEGCSTHAATWAVVNAYQAMAEDQEEINEDF